MLHKEIATLDEVLHARADWIDVTLSLPTFGVPRGLCASSTPRSLSPASTSPSSSSPSRASAPIR